MNASWYKHTVATTAGTLSDLSRLEAAPTTANRTISPLYRDWAIFRLLRYSLGALCDSAVDSLAKMPQFGETDYFDCNI